MKAAIYARYSEGRDRDKASTKEAQLAMCREKAASEGVIIDEEHISILVPEQGWTMQRLPDDAPCPNFGSAKPSSASVASIFRWAMSSARPAY